MQGTPRLVPPLTTVLALALALTTARSAAAGVKVVTTVPDLAALAAEIGGKRVELTTMSLSTQDPHFVDPKPSLVLKLNKAALLITVGLDLEVGWMPRLQTSARNPKILAAGSGFLDCSTAVRVLDVPAGPVDRSMGDIHPAGNPHYLYDPRAAIACARAIAARLSAIDPAGARIYAANLATFATRVDEARAGWEARMKPLRGKQVITYHRSWSYLLAWLGLVELDALEPKAGVPPSPRHVAAVIERAKAAGVKVVVQEAYYPGKLGALVASRLGGSVVMVPGGAAIERGETYVQRMERVVAALEKALP